MQSERKLEAEEAKGVAKAVLEGLRDMHGMKMAHTGMGLGHVPCEQPLIRMTEALGSATRNCVTWVALYEWTRTPGM